MYRNCGYQMPVSLQDTLGAPFLTPGWDFRLEITPAAFDRSWTEPFSFAQQQASGSGASGTTFILHEEDTAALDYRTAYQWRVLVLPPGADPAALIGGSVKVFDGPVMPQVNLP